MGLREFLHLNWLVVKSLFKRNSISHLPPERQMQIRMGAKAGSFQGPVGKILIPDAKEMEKMRKGKSDEPEQNLPL